MHTIFPPFHTTDWRAIDDRIRGGSSISHLDPAPHSHHGVRFWGTLDTTTLGGAGFASQCYTFPSAHGLWLPETSYAGIGIVFDLPLASELKPDAPTRFTLVLKTGIPPLRGDGRRESTVSYEYTFTTATTPTDSHTRRLTIPWSAFVPTYRGRTITPHDPQYVPLDPGSTTEDGKRRGGITEMSLMCRSDFGKQQGEFSLVVRRIEALPVLRSGDAEAGEKGPEAGDGYRPVGSRFPALSWTALGLVAVACVGLTYVVARGWRF